jgi:ERCC4-type nuclease
MGIQHVRGVCESRLSHEQTVGELKSYAKPVTKYPSKKKQDKTPSETEISPALSLQSKIVLLTLAFPRLRIIWASSSYAAADIFNDLKLNNPEPDARRAVAIGADENSEAGVGINAAPEGLLRCLPGITAKNVKYVMSKVHSVRELCEMSLSQVQGVMGVEPGKACWEFMHRGEPKEKTGVFSRFSCPLRQLTESAFEQVESVWGIWVMEITGANIHFMVRKHASPL